MSVPSHMYLQARRSRLGSNESAYRLLVAELSPSAATTRSWVADSASVSGASVWKCTTTPSSAHRSCRISSSRLRLIAANPCPPLVMTRSRKWTSMSSQRANSCSMRRWISASACSMPPSVSSEKTTPKPNVSSAALRSQTVISWWGPSCLARAEKYSPPGPPPMTAMRTIASELR